jgi:hypothetical protein
MVEEATEWTACQKKKEVKAPVERLTIVHRYELSDINQAM